MEASWAENKATEIFSWSNSYRHSSLQWKDPRQSIRIHRYPMPSQSYIFRIISVDNKEMMGIVSGCRKDLWLLGAWLCFRFRPTWISMILQCASVSFLWVLQLWWPSAAQSRFQVHECLRWEMVTEYHDTEMNLYHCTHTYQCGFLNPLYDSFSFCTKENIQI